MSQKRLLNLRLGNFRIMDDNLGTGGPKEKFWRNIKAIATLKQIEQENRHATLEEQHLLSQYVGWGGISMLLTRRSLHGLRSFQS